MKARKIVALGVAAIATLLSCLALATWQLSLGRPTQPVLTADLAHSIATAAGLQGIRDTAVRQAQDLPLETLLMAVAPATWRLAQDNAGGADPVSAICIAALAPTGFFTPPPRALELLQLRGVRVIDPRRCSFTTYDNVSYRTVALLRRRAWLLWVGLPEQVEVGEYSVETGYWAAGLHGASWHCRVQRQSDGLHVDSCAVQWVS